MKLLTWSYGKTLNTEQNMQCPIHTPLLPTSDKDLTCTYKKFQYETKTQTIQSPFLGEMGSFQDTPKDINYEPEIFPCKPVFKITRNDDILFNAVELRQKELSK